MNSKVYRIILSCFISFFCISLFGQTKKNVSVQWVVVDDDEAATISYSPKMITGKNGHHFVWIKTVYHTNEWQRYLARKIGSRVPIAMTKTKAEYDDIYSYVRVRQVICYNKAGKQIYDTGDDLSAGWGPVNASDPVGIVGEYIERENSRNPFRTENRTSRTEEKTKEAVVQSEPPKKEETKVYDEVEQMPSFPGGIAALMSFLSNNINYPKEAFENGIQGRVVCTFVVERDGSITDIRVVRGVHPLLDKEARRVLQQMPCWIPGKQNGDAVRVKFTVPVTFRLQ